METYWNENFVTGKLVGRLARHSFGRNFLSKIGPRFIQKTWSDFSLYLDLQDRWGVSKYILKHGNYDPEMCEIVRSILKPGASCLDIGANIGFWTNFLASSCKAKQIYAIEPEPGNLCLLKENISLNQNETRVEVHHCAVGDAEGTMKLYLSKDNAGDHKLYATSEERDFVEIQVKRVDDLIGSRKIDFVKIDVQGYEHYVFKGMRSVFENNPNLVMLMEFWPKGITDAGAKPQETLEYLSSLGFRFFYFTGGLSSGQWIETPQEKVIALAPEGHHVDLLLSRTSLQGI